MTTATRAVLAYLATGSKTAGEVGRAVWGGRRRGRVAPARGGGDYAAQMLLGRLRRLGLVQVYSMQGGSSCWDLTQKGREAIAPPAPRRRIDDAKP